VSYDPDGTVEETAAHQVDHGLMRLSGDFGGGIGGGGNRRHDGSCPREQGVLDRIGGVGVGGDEPGAVADRVGRGPDPVVGDPVGEPDHDTARLARVLGDWTAFRGPGLVDPRFPDHEDGQVGCTEHRHGRLRGGTDVARPELDTRQLADPPGRGRRGSRRVVGDEEDASARLSEPQQRFGDAREHTVAPVYDAVDVADDVVQDAKKCSKTFSYRAVVFSTDSTETLSSCPWNSASISEKVMRSSNRPTP